MKRRLYVGNLSYETDSTELEEIFVRVGDVERVDVITDYITGESKGFGFVDMKNEEDAWTAMCLLDGCFLKGKQLVVRILEGNIAAEVEYH